MIQADITTENWREYEWEAENGMRIVRIDNPLTLFMRPGGTTHRVWDGNIVHCIPAPGHWGCVLRWAPKDPTKPVAF